MYPEVVEFLRQAGTYRCLTCSVAVDALPAATSVYELAQPGAGNPDRLQSEKEIVKAKADFTPAPALFENTKH
jgi:hypothetical protein